MAKKYLDLNGLTTFWAKVKTLVGNYVPTTRKVNNKPLSADITLSASDVGAAASSHTHSYAGSDSAGGAANSVKANMTVKLNGGTTEGTNLFTFNGGTAKTIDVTPSAIGAAAASHTHNYAGSSSAGGAANSVASSLTLKLNGGTTEGTNMFTFNGGTAKSVNITASAIGAATASDIATAIAALNAIKISIVSSLPAVGSAQANTIYFVSNTTSSSDNYDEYMLINGAFEKVGNTAVDLTGYVQDTDLVEITTAEISALV